MPYLAPALLHAYQINRAVSLSRRNHNFSEIDAAPVLIDEKEKYISS